MKKLYEYLINKNNIKSGLNSYNSDRVKEESWYDISVDNIDELNNKKFFNFLLYNSWENSYGKYDVKILIGGNKPIKIDRLDSIKNDVLVRGYLPDDNGEFPKRMRDVCSCILNKTWKKKNWHIFKERILDILI